LTTFSFDHFDIVDIDIVDFDIVDIDIVDIDIVDIDIVDIDIVDIDIVDIDIVDIDIVDIDIDLGRYGQKSDLQKTKNKKIGFAKKTKKNCSYHPKMDARSLVVYLL
jgi:hypothetical protein